MKKKRTPKEVISPLLRWAVWERDDFRCHYCGSRQFLSIDHVQPESAGGATELGNLVTACSRCNSRKCARSYSDFVEASDLDSAQLPSSVALMSYDEYGRDAVRTIRLDALTLNELHEWEATEMRNA